MTDRELLEMTAKAVGIEIMHWIGSDPHSPKWNPLTDDSDALRLLVKLSMPIEFREPGFGYKNLPENKRVMCGMYWDSNSSCYDMLGELCGSDKQAATRRVIVRAAAEIGKAMP